MTIIYDTVKDTFNKSPYNKKNFLLDTWPLTIFKTRYGNYENGDWCAVPLKYFNIHKDALGSDGECVDWFVRNEKYVGVGNSPTDALVNLMVKVSKYY